MWPPKQAPQVGVEMAAPAAAMISSSPSAKACRQIACVAGTTIMRTLAAMLRALQHDATWRRSVIVPFAQLPT